MGRVSFQVLDGLERGEVFRDLGTPVNLGREEDNHIRLNDERVSRFHAKVQEHNGQYIITDLESTNGTRVNGHPVHMHVLRLGDQVLIGRCLLVFGSPEELAERIIDSDDDPTGTADQIEGRQTDTGSGEVPDLFPAGPPPVPRGLNAIQTAEASDVLAYLHSSLLQSLYSVQGEPNPQSRLEEVTISANAWHRLQRLQMDLSKYLNEIAQPQERET